jgi:hypothetical protein
MHRIGKFLMIGAAALCITSVLAAAVFDRVAVAPVVAKARAAIANAASNERELPASVERALNRYVGNRLKFLAARYALTLQSSSEARESSSQIKEAGIGFFLPLHFSDKELLSFYASQVHMGPGVKGFSQAATYYINVPLEKLDRFQIAKLVAISHGPLVYLENPERLEKKVKQLLSEKSQ